MSEVLNTSGLTKNFGKLTAVDQLDLSINEGQVFGILGPNGSGKTTTLGILLDVISPTSGSYKWFGGQRPSDARKRIGSILETPSFFPYLSAVQNLRIVAHIKDVKGTERIEEVLKQVGLFERRNDKFKAYSLGMKQRLSIGAALLADPPILILDEPTNGLDPEGIAEVRQLIKSIANEGKTIIVASHLLDEVQKVCTDFCVLRQGKKLYQGSVADILGETNRVEIEAADNDQAKALLEKFEGITDVQNNGQSLIVSVSQGHSSEDLNTFFHTNGISLKKVLPIKHSLEDEFLKILREND